MTVDLQALRARAERCRIDEIEVWPPDLLKLIAAVDALRGLVEHIQLNGGCHRGCDQHDVARAALDAFPEPVS